MEKDLAGEFSCPKLRLYDILEARKNYPFAVLPEGTEKRPNFCGQVPMDAQRKKSFSGDIRKKKLKNRLRRLNEESPAAGERRIATRRMAGLVFLETSDGL